MKSQIAKLLDFEVVEKMGFVAPKSTLVDFSDETYNAAADRCEIRQKDGAQILLVEGEPFKMTFDGRNWYGTEDFDIQEAKEFFNL